jgi:hypothetical protein
MNYCSLKDAWGSNDYISSQFKEYMHPAKHVELFESVDKVDKNDKVNMVYVDNNIRNTKHDDEMTCDNVIQHIKNCKRCYKKVQNFMKINLHGFGFGNLINENRDVIVLILIGISLMLFFNLVSNIAKK